MTEYKQLRLQLWVNGELIHEIEVTRRAFAPVKKGASTVEERYHHAFIILKRMAERRVRNSIEDIEWAIYELYKSRAMKDERPVVSHHIGEYSNRDHISEVLSKAV